MAEKTIRVGIIGCGGRGREHAKGCDAAPQVQVVALADPVAEAANKLAEKYPGAQVFEDYRIMLREARPDLVSVCTWTGQHHHQVLDCVAAGVKAIHAEKPMAPTYGEAVEMHHACESAGVQLTFCHQRRFAAQFVKARELARSGAVGEVYRLEGFCPNLFDWGTHWFDMFHYFNDETPAEWVMGQIEIGEARTVFGVPVESYGLSYIQFQNGVHGLLVTGKDNGGRCANRILGTEGIIELGVSDGESLRVMRGQGWETVDLTGAVPPGGDTVHSVLDAIACLESGAEPLLSSRKALRATELIFATYESSRRRGRVTLPLEITDSPLQAMIEEAGQGAGSAGMA